MLERLCAECRCDLGEETGDNQFLNKTVCFDCFVELCKTVVLEDIRQEGAIKQVLREIQSQDIREAMLALDPEYQAVKRIVHGERLLASIIIDAHTVRN
jgi:hypothetical protein